MTAALRAGDPISARVGLDGRAYDIVIGRGEIASLGRRIAALRPGCKVAIVTDETVARHHLAATEQSLTAAGVGTAAIRVPAGEASKSFGVFERVCDGLIAARIERGDLVVALGGGVVGDLAGFAGAGSITCRCRPRCWPRSIRRSAARPRSTPAGART
jgi:3-dehydroquinate synthetase